MQKDRSLFEKRAVFFCRFLFSDRSVHRAVAGASAAIDAGIRVDLVLAVTLGDRADGAAIRASAASDASVRDFVCHEKSTSFVKVILIIPYLFEIASVFIEICVCHIILPIVLAVVPQELRRFPPPVYPNGDRRAPPSHRRDASKRAASRELYPSALSACR